MRRDYVKAKTLALQVLCPVDINIYDSQGNHTGKILDTEYEQNIESTNYYQNGDEKTVFLPDEKFNVSTLNQGVTNQFAICSENGNININGSKCEINGILYAPKGTVTINTSNFILNGTIIADKIIINGSTININHSDDVTKLIDK